MDNILYLEIFFICLMALISVCIAVGAYAVLKGLFAGQK